MKRPQSSSSTNLESIRKAYKKARAAYKHGDKSNHGLKKAKVEAKKLLEEAQAAATETISSSENDSSAVETAETSLDPVINTDDPVETETPVGSETIENKHDEGTTADAKTKLLEEAYQKALSEFKANKTDKDLRRAKTAARRTLDEVIAAATNGTQLTCINCSKKFIFTTEEQENYNEMGWKEVPKRCETCKKVRYAGRDSGDYRAKLDAKKKNMCYAFQRGECPHGDNCKFSHNPECGGKRSNSDSVEKDENEEDDDPMKVKESNERKERGLKKGKGKRNK